MGDSCKHTRPCINNSKTVRRGVDKCDSYFPKAASALLLILQIHQDVVPRQREWYARSPTDRLVSETSTHWIQKHQLKTSKCCLSLLSILVTAWSTMRCHPGRSNHIMLLMWSFVCSRGSPAPWWHCRLWCYTLYKNLNTAHWHAVCEVSCTRGRSGLNNHHQGCSGS